MRRTEISTVHTTANPATHHFRLEHINLGAELVLLGIVKLLVRSALCLVLSLHNRAREKPHQQRLESKWKAKLTTRSEEQIGRAHV